MATFKRDEDYWFNVSAHNSQTAISAARAGRCVVALDHLTDAVEHDARGAANRVAVYTTAAKRAPAMIQEAKKAIASACMKSSAKKATPAEPKPKKAAPKKRASRK